MLHFIQTFSARTAMLLLASGLACGALAGSASAADQSAQLTFGGKVRTYTVHMPDRAPPTRGFPVILAFHGGGMQGAGMARMSGLDAVADKRGFIAVYPDGLDKHWNDGRLSIKNPQDDVGFVSALLDKLAADHTVDKARIYATGISNGALFAERLGCDLSQRISAIAPVAGTLPVATSRDCRPARPVAVLQIDGTADPIMPFNGGGVKSFGGKGEGGEVLAVKTTAQFWARHDGCTAAGPKEMLPPIAPLDHTRIVRVRALGCMAGGEVTALAVVGGGHTWPGGPQYAPRLTVGVASRQMNASAVIADFFLSQPRRS